MLRPSATLPGGARVRLALLGGLVAILGALALRPAASDPADSVPAGADAQTPPPIPAPARTFGVDSCEALALRADDPPADDPQARTDDPVVLGFLCPDTPLSPLTARALLLGIADPIQAAFAAERLAQYPALAALARFVAAQRIALPAADPAVPLGDDVPRPELASVSPMSQAVVRDTQRARAALYAKGVSHAARTRAHAFVAKAALQAVQQLGVAPGEPAPPLVGLLAATGLHHGRLMAEAHWASRVQGLAPLFDQIQDAMLATLLVLQATPYQGDTARAIVERGRVRDYVLRSGTRARIDQRHAERSPGQPATAAVWGLGEELTRLVAHGWVDLAVVHIAAQARAEHSPGLDTLERLLTDMLLAADRDELATRVQQRLALVRDQLPATGSGAPPTAAATDVRLAASTLADAVTPWFARALAPGAALSRRYALGRALVPLRTRPDVVAVLVDRAVTIGDPALLAALDLLLPLLRGYDGRRLATMRLLAAADAVRPEPATLEHLEARRRRQYAATLRAP